MDYTKFLGKKEEVVLAYLGGAHVFGKDRRLRVDEPRPTVGFHRFEVRGRSARALGAAEPELGALPRVSGHHVAGFLVHPGGLDRLALLPDEEPPPLAKARARRWWSDDLLFDALDFDTEVEEEARLRLERREPIATLKGVAPTLRLAFGIAAALELARTRRVPLSVREAKAGALDVAERGAEAASALLDRIERERREAAERQRVADWITNRPPAPRARSGAEIPTPDNASARAEAALENAGARMLSSRRRGHGQLEVAFEFMSTRFISVVDEISLQVFDSGVCLAGADSRITLDSLPGVIREAIDDDVLVITRHS